MTLAANCCELHQIAELLVQEHELIRCMRAHGEAPCEADEARAYAGGISQLHLMNSVLLCAALDLELEAALNPA